MGINVVDLGTVVSSTEIGSG